MCPTPRRGRNRPARGIRPLSVTAVTPREEAFEPTTSPERAVQCPGLPPRSARGFDIVGSRLTNGLLGNEPVCCALTELDHAPTTSSRGDAPGWSV